MSGHPCVSLRFSVDLSCFCPAIRLLELGKFPSPPGDGTSTLKEPALPGRSIFPPRTPRKYTGLSPGLHLMSAQTGGAAELERRSRPGLGVGVARRTGEMVRRLHLSPPLAPSLSTSPLPFISPAPIIQRSCNIPGLFRGRWFLSFVISLVEWTSIQGTPVNRGCFSGSITLNG